VRAGDEVGAFRVPVNAALGPLVRIRKDDEGWPEAVGRYGRLEWRGVEQDGQPRIYIFTDRPRMISKIRPVAGVHQWQLGDDEAAFWIRSDDVDAIRAVARLLKLRTRRAPGLPVPPGFAARPR
jgi:hypothetical protein